MVKIRCPLKVVWWLSLSNTFEWTHRCKNTTSPACRSSVPPLEEVPRWAVWCEYAKKVRCEFLTNTAPEAWCPTTPRCHSKWYAPLTGAVKTPVGHLFLSFQMSNEFGHINRWKQESSGTCVWVVGVSNVGDDTSEDQSGEFVEGSSIYMASRGQICWESHLFDCNRQRTVNILTGHTSVTVTLLFYDLCTLPAWEEDESVSMFLLLWQTRLSALPVLIFCNMLQPSNSE